MSKQKNVLKIEKKVMIKCDYHDLNEFIKNELKLPQFEFIADEELNNDSTWTTNVRPEEMDYKEFIAILRGGSTMYQSGALMNQLCFEGKLEAGEYAVDICW